MRHAATMTRVSYPPPPPPYGYAPYRPPDHPQANTILVLGILSFFCGLVGPFAWMMGRQALRDIDTSGGMIGGRSNVQVGYIIGIATSLLTAFSLVLLIVWVVGLVVVGIVATSS